MVPPDQSLEASLARLDELLDRRRQSSISSSDFTSRPGVAPAYVLTVWGLTAQVFRQAEFLRPNLARFGHEVIPIVRSQYETALMAQWIVLRGPKALPGFLNEGVRQRVNLGRSLLDAGWDGVSDELLQQLRAEKVRGESLEQEAKTFLRVVQDFRGHETLYALYRYMSGFTHPSATMVDEYALERKDQAHGVSLLWEPRPRDDSGWGYIVVWSLVWAAQALDSITKSSPDRFFLKDLAKESGMSQSGLLLTDEATTRAWLDEYAAGQRSKSDN